MALVAEGGAVGPKTEVDAKDAKSNSSYKWYGATLGVVGFIVLVIGGLTIIGQLTATALESDALVLVGLALLVVGCGVFGLGWTNKEWPAEQLSTGAKWSVLATIVTTVLVAFIALWADKASNVLWAVVSVGALGGLVHEIAQSKGTAFLPGQGTQPNNPAGQGTPAPSAGGAPPKGKADSGGKGEDYLGGLVGVILGGAAGLLTLGATSGTAVPTTVSLQVIVAAFSAGIALKGISDSAASPTVKSKSSG
ncbi:MAG TPA: hypothetical protein VLY21_05985 [Nitrososphaerales archaeon]|nr:hypothetical protein [Nitrososphaerales archaeon]